jgi:hypothetical protein
MKVAVAETLRKWLSLAVLALRLASYFGFDFRCEFETLTLIIAAIGVCQIFWRSPKKSRRRFAGKT